MKKSLKRTCAIALALAATAGVTGIENVQVRNANNNVVYADGEQQQSTQPGVLSISNYEKNVNIGAWFDMPTAWYEQEGNTSGITYKVAAPSGKEITPTEPTGKKLGFAVNEIGEYKITYMVDTGSIKYTGVVTFVSSVSKQTITLEENNSRILPSKVGTEDSTANFFVPSYKVTDATGKEITGVNTVISVKTPSGESVTVNAETGKVNFAEGYKFEEGTYIVDYFVYDANGAYLDGETREFLAVAGKAYKEGSELVVSFTSEAPDSINIGNPTKLPGVTAKINGEAVPVYYDIQVLNNGTPLNKDELVGENKVLEYKDGAYYFTAKEIVNNYTVKYTVKSAGGEFTKEHEFEIDKVKDTLQPTPIVVGYYDTATVSNPEDISYELRSNFTDKNITILPIYAKDLGSFKFSDYKVLKREIKNSSYEVKYTDTENPNKTIVFNHDSLVANKFIEEGKYIIARDENDQAIKLSDGTYTVVYTAEDSNGNKKEVSYKFVVDADFETNDAKPVKAPTVEYNDTFFIGVDKGEEITFGKPTFSDDKDERLETKVYYRYFKMDGETEVALGEDTALELNDNNKYVINTADAVEGATFVKIFAYAKNDSGKETTAVKKVEVYSPVSGTNAPTVKLVGTDGTDSAATVKVGTEIKLPSITFEDLDDIKTLDASVSITYEIDGKIVNAEAQNGFGIRNKAAKTYTYAGASFTPGVAGVYTVAVKAVDAEGNVTVKFIQYNVEEIDGVGAIRFTNLGLTDVELELGETFKLPAADISYPGKAQDVEAGVDSPYTYIVRKKSGPNGEGEKLNEDRFAPTKVGEYVLEYVMYNANNMTPVAGVESYEFKVTVKDTTAPEIYVDWRTTIIDNPNVENTTTGEAGKETIVKDSPVQIQSAYDVKTKILLPYFSAKDLSGIDTAKSLITITNKATSSTRTIKFDKMEEEYSQSGDLFYEFRKDGEYTITYTAYDLQGNSSKETFTIKIGDLDDPKLEISDEALKSKYSIGDEISFDLTDDTKGWFTVTDADADLTKKDIKVKLTVAGVEVENQETDKGKYRFKLDKAGSYKVSFTVEDVAGNETVVEKSFEIAEKSESSVTGTEALGIVLIVVSVVVLAGVVVYFVISKRKMDKLYR